MRRQLITFGMVEGSIVQKKGAVVAPCTAVHIVDTQLLGPATHDSPDGIAGSKLIPRPRRNYGNSWEQLSWLKSSAA